MERASSVWLPGLAYARVVARGRRRALWLPLFVADYDLLLALIAIHGGPQHPLLRVVDPGTACKAA
jgi:hypothetical protein